MAGSVFLKVPWKKGIFYKRDLKFDQIFMVSPKNVHDQVKKSRAKNLNY